MIFDSNYIKYGPDAQQQEESKETEIRKPGGVGGTKDYSSKYENQLSEYRSLNEEEKMEFMLYLDQKKFSQKLDSWHKDKFAF